MNQLNALYDRHILPVEQMYLYQVRGSSCTARLSKRSKRSQPIPCMAFGVPSKKLLLSLLLLLLLAFQLATVERGLLQSETHGPPRRRLLCRKNYVHSVPARAGLPQRSHWPRACDGSIHGGHGWARHSDGARARVSDAARQALCRLAEARGRISEQVRVLSSAV